MTLRIMLLGLVASMGFELPSGSDVSRWVEASRNWADSTMADRSGRLCEQAVKPVVAPTDCHQAEEPCQAPLVAIEPAKVVDDQAFEAASNDMAASFAADLIANASEPKAADDVVPSIVAEVLETPVIGLPAGEEVATQVVLVEEIQPEMIAVVDQPTATEEVTDAMHERLDRISSAIKLTREAVQAWAEVIQDPVDETSPAY